MFIDKICGKGREGERGVIGIEIRRWKLCSK